MCSSMREYEGEIRELRKEIAELRAANAKLKEQLDILSEMYRELSQRNSKNSSVPPSSDRKANYPTSYNRGGALPGHMAHIRKLLDMDRVDVTYVHKMDHCPACGSSRLVGIEAATPFQFIELIRGRCIVAQHECFRYRCRCCQNRFSAPLPEGIGPSNYGSRLQAAVAMLTGHFHLSKRQTAEFFDQFFSVPMSDGTVCKIERRVTKALSDAYEQVSESIQENRGTKFVDETSWRDQHRNGYVWLAANKAFSLFNITYSRCRSSRDQLIGKNFQGPIVTDRYGVYDDLAAPHQNCLAHLKRNFTKYAEGKGNPRWIAIAVIREIDAAFRLWHRFQGGDLSRRQLVQRTNYRRQKIQKLLEIGEAEPIGKFHRFCRNLLERYDRFWVYLRVPDMEPTNNEAERSLRSIVLWRKKSLGTKSDAGMRFVETISTVCQTLKKQKRKLLDFISVAMEGLKPSLI